MSSFVMVKLTSFHCMSLSTFPLPLGLSEGPSTDVFRCMVHLKSAATGLGSLNISIQQMGATG